jgi:hypothetical protein
MASITTDSQSTSNLGRDNKGKVDQKREVSVGGTGRIPGDSKDLLADNVKPEAQPNAALKKPAPLPPPPDPKGPAGNPGVFARLARKFTKSTSQVNLSQEAQQHLLAIKIPKLDELRVVGTHSGFTIRAGVTPPAAILTRPSATGGFDEIYLVRPEPGDHKALAQAVKLITKAAEPKGFIKVTLQYNAAASVAEKFTVGSTDPVDLKDKLETGGSSSFIQKISKELDAAYPKGEGKNGVKLSSNLRPGVAKGEEIEIQNANRNPGGIQRDLGGDETSGARGSKLDWQKPRTCTEAIAKKIGKLELVKPGYVFNGDEWLLRYDIFGLSNESCNRVLHAQPLLNSVPGAHQRRVAAYLASEQLPTSVTGHDNTRALSAARHVLWEVSNGATADDILKDFKGDPEPLKGLGIKGRRAVWDHIAQAWIATDHAYGAVEPANHKNNPLFAVLLSTEQYMRDADKNKTLQSDLTSSPP